MQECRSAVHCMGAVVQSGCSRGCSAGCSAVNHSHGTVPACRSAVPKPARLCRSPPDSHSGHTLGSVNIDEAEATGWQAGVGCSQRGSCLRREGGIGQRHGAQACEHCGQCSVVDEVCCLRASVAAVDCAVDGAVGDVLQARGRQDRVPSTAVEMPVGTKGTSMPVSSLGSQHKALSMAKVHR